MKNRLGAYHEPVHTIIDPKFLRTLPESEIRNGIAEILKITSCTHRETLELLERHGETLIETHFGQLGGGHVEDISGVADKVIRQGKISHSPLFSSRAPEPRPTDISPLSYP